MKSEVVKVASAYLRHNKKLAIRQFPNVAIHSLEMRTKPLHSHSCPYTIFIEPTIRCNLRCPMCDLDARQRKAKDMTKEQFKELLDRLPLVAHIHLQGLGEPFLNKDLLSMVALASSRGVSVDTTTNATLLDETVCRELLLSGLSRLFISIDGSSPETYEAVRVGAKFDSVMSNLRALAHAKAGLQSSTEICLWFVGTKDNIHQLPHMVEMVADLGASALYADSTHDWGKEAVKDRISKAEIAEDRYKVESCVDFAQMRARELGVALNVLPLLERIYNGNVKTGPCRWPWYSFYITVEGYVVPCCLRPDPRELNFGNLFQSDFRSIWNSPTYQVFRDNLRRGIMPEHCKGCPFWA